MTLITAHSGFAAAACCAPNGRQERGLPRMRDDRMLFRWLIALCAAALAACSNDAATTDVHAQLAVTIDRASLPQRYSSPLPSTAEGVQAWADRAPALPPVGHVVDLLLTGDPAMLSAVQRSAERVPPNQTEEWVGAWRSVLRFRIGSPAYCESVRPLMAGPTTPLRDALAGAYAATCRGPEDVKHLLRPDAPYWATIEAYQTDYSGYPAPTGHEALIRAAERALDAGDQDALREAGWTLAKRTDPEAWAALGVLHARVSDRKQADQLSMAFFRTGDPRLHDLAWRACARMTRPHTMCESGPQNNSHSLDLPAPPKPAASDVSVMRQKLADAGFPGMADTPAQSFDSADATSMLAVAGHVYAFDAETDQFPNEHDALLRKLAPLVQPALADTVFEEQFPDAEDGPYRLIAYLDGKRYQMQARNLGDWYDVDAVLLLLNTILADRGRSERFANLHTGDQVALVVGGPQTAITSAFESGLLESGDAGEAEQHGKAFEERVLKTLKSTQRP